MTWCMPLSSNSVQGGVQNPLTNGAPECVTFSNHYCSQFNNRTTAYFPNPRGHKTFEDADAEFSDFIPLLQSGCHEKLGTLLCFIYFPFCQTAYPSLRIYPCKEVCEEVHASNCTTFINQFNRDGWNDKLQCDLSDIYLPRSSMQCADGVAPLYPGRLII